ncbi:cytochrome c oxidase subunit 2A [Bacillus sp. 2205SS5-2]|uniref:cytochrome c oxidase subunit 2A n=1 Tax=Bacillus sp. 2205SS5-2 TaxID=3109031 RepID=UPI00300770EF
MGKPQSQLPHNPKSKLENERNSLKGTLAAVSILGAFIVVTWFIVFYIFIDRF